MSRLAPLINVVNPAAADDADSFWYMDHGYP